MLELAVDRESIASLLPAPKLPMKYVGIGACLLPEVYACASALTGAASSLESACRSLDAIERNNCEHANKVCE